MNERRESHFAVDMGDGKIWITGGYTPILSSSSTEILENGAFTPGPTLPMETAEHCMARVSETEFILAGGNNINDGAYLFSTESGSWTTLQPMSHGRVKLGCGTYTKAGKT